MRPNTVGSASRLVLDGRYSSAARLVILGFNPHSVPGWLAALFLPVGLLARFGWAFGAAVALSLGFLLILPLQIGLMPTPPVELVGALAGFLVGWVSQRATQVSG
jgi:hypothetical protein